MTGSFSWSTPDFDDSAWPPAKQVDRQKNYADWPALDWPPHDEAPE